MNETHHKYPGATAADMAQGPTAPQGAPPRPGSAANAFAGDMGGMHGQGAGQPGPQAAASGMHHAGMQGPQAGAPGMQHAWAGPQAAGGYSYMPHPGYYAAPPQGWQPPPYAYATPGQVAAPPPGVAGPDGFAAAMNDIADKNGLGMFKSFLNFDDGEFWKGALVGAAVVLLMTNEDLRKSLLGGAAKTAEAFKSGLAGFTGGAASSDDAREQTNEEENAQ